MYAYEAGAEETWCTNREALARPFVLLRPELLYQRIYVSVGLMSSIALRIAKNVCSNTDVHTHIYTHTQCKYSIFMVKDSQRHVGKIFMVQICRLNECSNNIYNVTLMMGWELGLPIKRLAAVYASCFVSYFLCPPLCDRPLSTNGWTEKYFSARPTLGFPGDTQLSTNNLCVKTSQTVLAVLF